jgi:2-(1,2-epoxy-1,2-dihydrophenyl)acetyl-CoA isomerase
MSDNPVLLDISQGVATITLNEPDTLNALTTEMVSRFIKVVKQVEDDESVRAIILTGAGRGFCSGMNLTHSAAELLAKGSAGLHRVMQEVNALLVRIAEMEKPWLAAVNGPAVGGGCSLALVCDLVLAAESTYLSASYIKIGLMMDMGLTYLLPYLVGLRRANELAFFGERIPATQAVEIGLINRAVPDEELMATSQAWAQRLAKAPTMAIAANKRLMQRAQHSTYSEALDWEALMLTLITQSEDLQEGVKAFVEKREPSFKGR